MQRKLGQNEPTKQGGRVTPRPRMRPELLWSCCLGGPGGRQVSIAQQLMILKWMEEEIERREAETRQPAEPDAGDDAMGGVMPERQRAALTTATIAMAV